MKIKFLQDIIINDTFVAKKNKLYECEQHGKWYYFTSEDNIKSAIESETSKVKHEIIYDVKEE